MAVVKIGSSVTQAGKDSCLTGNLLVSAFDLKHIAKTDLEEPFYNEVRENIKGNVIGTLTAVSMLFGSRGKRTERTTSNIFKVSLLSDQVKNNLTTTMNHIFYENAMNF